MKIEKTAENQTRFHSMKHKEENVLFEIECPKCQSKKSYCESNYKTGTKAIYCPECDYTRILNHKKAKNGYFIWYGKTKNPTISDLINEEILIDKTLAMYFIETNDGGGDYGRLKTQNDYDNFVEYLVILSRQKHNMKKASIVMLADDMATEMVF